MPRLTQTTQEVLSREEMETKRMNGNTVNVTATIKNTPHPNTFQCNIIEWGEWVD